MTTFLPPTVRAVISIISDLGYTVSVRNNRYGSNRYSVNGGKEINGWTLINRFDNGEYCGDRAISREISKGN